MDMKNLQEFHSALSSVSPLPSSSPISNLHPLDIGAEEWEIAERRVHEILSVIQPTLISEHRRKDVIEYIQILFGASYGIKVFPFGSVPLKTYLPDGDIDLTVMCHHDEEALSNVFCCLHNEETTNTHIQVRNVQCVPAQIKVVKCYVEGIAVDITFNQMSGLCALSFLEQVDQLIGKDHLFKRSVILIKAWCFYESRILGAHHGLISPYALETMVAHIINLFHSSMHSSLAVLYKFLAYYSKFDWENHCVAINGLVLISSLPELVAQPPNGADEMLLSTEFLKKCRESYSVSTGMNQTGGHPFHLKFLNVVDPLRDNNNIGRSVNKANFSRLKHALSFSIKKLNFILASPLEEISIHIAAFFKTTLARNHSGSRPDCVPVPAFVANENLLAGIEYGLWSHDFGIYQGCNDTMLPEMWTKWNQLGLGGRYDPNALFQVNENFAPFPDAYNFSSATNVSPFGEIPKSRGTGTYIPQPVFPPFPAPNLINPYVTDEEAFYNFVLESIEFKNQQTLPYYPFVPSDDFPQAFDLPINVTNAEEENELLENEEEMPVVEGMNEFPDLSGLRLGDTSEFPPLLGKKPKLP